MNHEEFFQSIKASPPGGLYLFEGEEEYIKQSALRQLENALSLGAFAEMNRTVLKDPDAGTLIAALETLPFMADRRLVIVRDSGMLSGKAKDYDEAESADRLKKYIADLPPTAVLVFYVRGQADKRKKLYQALKKSVVQFSRLDQRGLRDYIARVLKKAGLSVTTDACEYLIYAVGDDLTTLLAETEKLIAYCDGRDSVTAEDIRAVCTVRSEYRIFELAQLVLQRKSREVFSMLRAMLADGEQPLMLLSLLNRQCRQIYDLRIMADHRASQPEMAAKLGVPPFALKQMLPLARAYTAEQLTQMVQECTQIEFEVKSGLLPEPSAIEQGILHIMTIGEGGNE